MKPEEIKEILNSIKSFRIDEDNRLQVKFHHSGEEEFVVEEYKTGTFTRELLELIEFHITEE